MITSDSETQVLEPFLIEPTFSPRIWGFSDLRPWFDVTPTEPVGEAWLTGDHCKIATGRLAGQTLGEVFALNSRAMLGQVAGGDGASPLLIKVLFAREKLSVQVHPDDRLAQKYGHPRGKTECWYALAAEPDASVAVGLRPGVTLDDVTRGIADHTLENDLQVIPVSAEDMIYVDAGTVHAIWPGSIILETQQNCDLTYRLYDYGRPRELHVAKAMEATRLHTEAGKVAPISREDRTILIEREYFRVEKIPVSGSRSGQSIVGESSFAEFGSGLNYLFAARGTGRISACGHAAFEAFDLPTRSIAAVPESSFQWQVEDRGGLELIRIAPRFSTEIV